MVLRVDPKPNRLYKKARVTMQDRFNDLQEEENTPPPERWVTWQQAGETRNNGWIDVLFWLKVPDFSWEAFSVPASRFQQNPFFRLPPALPASP